MSREQRIIREFKVFLAGAGGLLLLAGMGFITDHLNDTAIESAMLILCGYFAWRLFRLYRDELGPDLHAHSDSSKQAAIIIRKTKPKRKAKRPYEMNQLSNPKLPRRKKN